MDQTTAQGPEGLTRNDAADDLPAHNRRNDQNGHTATPSDTSFASDIRITELLRPISNLPKITIANMSSPPPIQAHYMNQSATISAHASLSDPFYTLLETEKPTNTFSSSSPPTSTSLLSSLVLTNKARLTIKLNQGSLILESSDFAATACWAPPWHPTAPTPQSFIDTLHAQGRHHFASFLTQIEAAKRRDLYPLTGTDSGGAKGHWELSLMARDPRREYAPGAVRAVVQPILDAAEREGVPVWLEAGSARARDVYAHFGLKVVATVEVGGITTWCMLKE